MRVLATASPAGVRETRRWSERLAVHGVFWRRAIDWIILHVAAWLHSPLILISALFFFFKAAPARKAVVQNLKAVLPGSSALVLQLRAFRTFYNFGWMLTDAAVHRLLRSSFSYELEGENFLRELAESKGAIVLTAHMGNYDLGAALFAEKFRRQIRMVRAPEPDAGAAQHVDLALAQSSAGAVKVEYSSAGTALSFDLLAALRKGEIISIQGDRVVGDVARAVVPIFGRDVALPRGPFVLSYVVETPIYPLFIVRSGFRKYKIIARQPIVARQGEGGRDAQIESAMRQWSCVLEETVRRYWPQWYAFTPMVTD